ncbi:dehydrogenase [Corynebacterium deserti GIMN1.010]|uniref:Dehydrogenase n=1 Tax=Corynebacterium deserti GIMN1.010 TaxID=931089 RepID=A0A0M4CQP8_9CORY|nr:Gfo/Idh/MocA family oxidoreductase [Corynebacterium deserti]ALC06292.1 dehydrogenase [Corynebacterium deserti GIMN1.010]
MTPNKPLRVALIGAGRIGSSHARILAHRVVGADLVAVVDPTPSAEHLATELGIVAYATAAELFDHDPVDAVIITTPARTHADLVVEAAAKGVHVFVEKPMAVTLNDAERAIAAARAADVVLQVGFNRRFAAGFAAARRRIEAGDIGQPQLLRSLTRDPGPYAGDPYTVPQWTIFLETLIHDFDTLCYLNPSARPVEVTAHADCLVVPEAFDSGFLDTATVTIRFDNGALATAEASFSAVYGYDVRGEVFGSHGMMTMGDIRATDMTFYGAGGQSSATSRADTELLYDAYLSELQSFVDAITTGRPSAVPGEAARTALTIALGAIRSVELGESVALSSSNSTASTTGVHAEKEGI